MFGLMSAPICSQSNALKLHRRLHYCGTCKSLETIYGRKSRVMLNNDTVFLAEILSSLSTDTETIKQWDGSFYSFNCLACPVDEGQIPFSLQYAATASLVLAEFKVTDQIIDSHRLVWKTAKHIFSRSFDKAAARLRGWDFPLDDLRQAILSQVAREVRAGVSRVFAAAVLDDLAEPTATATALFFGHGARLVGYTAHEQAMAALGHHFGAIIYLIDALHDFGKDLKRGDFNAVRAAFGLRQDCNTIPEEIREAVEKKIRTLQAEIERRLDQLPITESFKTLFAVRLHANLSRRIGRLPEEQTADLPLSHRACGIIPSTCRVRMTLSERWVSAVEFCKKLAHKQGTEGSTGVFSQCRAVVRKSFVFYSALPIAFLAPHQALEAESYRGCMSLGFNMIFVSTAIGSIALPVIRPVRTAVRSLSTFASGQLLMFGASQEHLPNHHKHGQDSNSSGCDCDCCDCCGSCDC